MLIVWTPPYRFHRAVSTVVFGSCVAEQLRSDVTEGGRVRCRCAVGAEASGLRKSQKSQGLKGGADKRGKLDGGERGKETWRQRLDN